MTMQTLTFFIGFGFGAYLMHVYEPILKRLFDDDKARIIEEHVRDIEGQERKKECWDADVYVECNHRDHRSY